MKAEEIKIAEYSKTALALADLQARYSAVVWDVSTTKGMAETKAARAEVRGYRVDLEAMRKEIKAPALERCRLIDDEAKRITAELVKLEQPIDAVIKAEEERKAAEKAEQMRIEAERIAGIRKQIEQIKDWALHAVRLSSFDIEKVVINLTVMEINLEQFAEFAGEAMQARTETIHRLNDLMDAARGREAEAARIIAEEKKAKEEAYRLNIIREKINWIKSMPAEAVCLLSFEVEEVIKKLKDQVVDANHYAEFTDEALQARCTSLSKLQDMRKTKADEEEERKRLVADRKAMEEAKAKAEAAAAAAAEVVRSKMEHERKLQEAENSRQQMEIARQQAEIRIQQEAIRKALAEEVARQKAEQDRIEAIKAERARQEAIEAEKETAKKYLTVRPSDREIIQALCVHFRAHEGQVIAWLQDMNLNSESI